MKNEDPKDPKQAELEDLAQKQKQAEQNREIEEILMASSEVPGTQLTISEVGELKSEQEIRDYAFGPIDNPEKKHNVYYHGIQKLLKTYLPKGQKHKRARDIIYDEKNLLLNRGKQKDARGIRGSDGRMAYLDDHDIVLDIISDWILAKGTPFELWNSLRKKNIELGYIGTKKATDQGNSEKEA